MGETTAAKYPSEGGHDERVARFDVAVQLIAVGLREKADLYEADQHRYPYSSHFRHGLGIYAALLAECARDKAADILPHLSEASFIRDYCTRDVSSWVDGWDDDTRRAALQSPFADYGPLAMAVGDSFILTDECEDLVERTDPGVVEDYQERRVYEYLAGGTQEQYTLGRLLLIKHPLLSYDDRTEMETGRYDFSGDEVGLGIGAAADAEWVAGLLDLAYEPTPRGTWVCPRCGWTLSLYGEQPRCVSPACREGLPVDIGQLPPVPPNSSRLRRGVMHCIAAPGRLELALAGKARELGLPFELWPQMDACDLLVTLPDGARLALDAKDYGNARRLAREVGHDTALTKLRGETGRVDEFVYVVPDETETRYPGFCRECDLTLRQREGYSCTTFGKLAKRLGKAAGGRA